MENYFASEIKKKLKLIVHFSVMKISQRRRHSIVITTSDYLVQTVQFLKTILLLRVTEMIILTTCG